MFDRQLDVFGDEHDIAPANERMRLFEPVKVMPGQTGMTLDIEEVQNRYIHWRTLELALERTDGPNDRLTAFYRNKRELVELLADSIGASVKHLDPARS